MPADRPAQRGMTLIEILVVLVLIGVVMATISLSVDLGGPEAKAEQQARRLAGLVRLQCEESLLMGRELGLHLDAGGYRFSSWDGQSWQPRDDAREFSAHPLPPPLSLAVALEGRELRLQTQDDLPQVVCSSSGEMTPFRILFQVPDPDRAYALAGELDGTLTLTGWTGDP